MKSMTHSFYTAASRLGFIALAASSFTLAQEVPAEAPAAPPARAEEAKADSSYTFGYQMGQQLNGYGIVSGDVDPEKLLEGFTAGVQGEKPGISQERVEAAMEAVGKMVQKREDTLAAKNLEAGKKFLEENGKREGVVTTESGLQYEILKKGGEEKYVEPKEGEPAKQFMVNYKGNLIDGTEFDASVPGSPVPMTMDVIPGLQEALKAMPVGAKWIVFVPSDLAYRDQRRSAEIAPNSVLAFEMELVEITDAPPAAEGEGFPMQPSE